MLRIVEKLFIDGETDHPKPTHSRVTGYWEEVLFRDLKTEVLRLNGFTLSGTRKS